MDALLKLGADEKLKTTDGKMASDLVGRPIYHHEHVDDDHWDVADPGQAELVHTLLARAPAERAWRRRGLFLMCCSRHGRAKERGFGSNQAQELGLVASVPEVVAMLRDDGYKIAKLVKVDAGCVGGQQECSSDDRGGRMTSDAGLDETRVAAGKLRALVTRVLNLEEEGLFRAIVLFL